MLTRYLVVLLTAFPLFACQSPEEIASADDARCRSYGGAPGSDAYVNCRVAQQKIRSDEDIAADTAIEARNRTCTKVGNTIDCF